MIVVSTDFVPGKRIVKTLGLVKGNTIRARLVKTLGLVKGNTIRARHIGKDVLAAMKNLMGGEIEEYTKMVAESREQSLDRMVEQARELGADAVINVRFTTSSMMQGAAELLAYGTAVKLEDETKRPETEG